MPKDFLGNEIHVGDKVFYSHTQGHGIARNVEKVLGATEKSVGIVGQYAVNWVPAWKVVNVTGLVKSDE